MLNHEERILMAANSTRIDSVAIDGEVVRMTKARRSMSVRIPVRRPPASCLGRSGHGFRLPLGAEVARQKFQNLRRCGFGLLHRSGGAAGGR